MKILLDLTDIHLMRVSQTKPAHAVQTLNMIRFAVTAAYPYLMPALQTATASIPQAEYVQVINPVYADRSYSRYQMMTLLLMKLLMKT
jgi:hypothetical protein